MSRRPPTLNPGSGWYSQSPGSFAGRRALERLVQAKHRWSGWPGAYCLNCGREDATELAAGEVNHRYSDVPHTEQPCQGCTDDTQPCP